MAAPRGGRRKGRHGGRPDIGDGRVWAEAEAQRGGGVRGKTMSVGRAVQLRWRRGSAGHGQVARFLGEELRDLAVGMIG
jgi:hypothetical protein